VPVADTIWAEDGQLFLGDALRDPIGSILTPAGGYLHVVPRVLAAVAAGLPIDWAATVMSVGSAVIVASLSVYIFVASQRIIPSFWSRAVISGLIVLLPAAGFESLASAANLQYFLLFGCFWALVDRGGSLGRVGAGSSVALATALSTTLSLLLVPLSLWNLATVRERRNRLTSIFFLAGVAIHLVIVFRAVVLATDPTLSQYPVRWSDSNLFALPGLYGLRVVAPLLVGDRLLNDMWMAMGWTFVSVVAISVTGAVIYGALRAASSPRAWTLVALCYSLLLFAVPVAVRGTEHLAPVGGMVTFNGNRYVIAPMWFLVTAGVILIAHRTGSSVAWRALGIGVVVLLLVQVASNYSTLTLRSAGPRWSAELEAARRRCVGSPQAGVRIPITPPVGPPGWGVETTCARVM
jgi:hypothetical protein